MAGNVLVLPSTTGILEAEDGTEYSFVETTLIPAALDMWPNIP